MALVTLRVYAFFTRRFRLTSTRVLVERPKRTGHSPQLLVSRPVFNTVAASNMVAGDGPGNEGFFFSFWMLDAIVLYRMTSDGHL